MSAAIKRGRLIRADLANWDGKTQSYSRIDATGGTVNGLVFGNEVDVLQVFGSGTTRTRGVVADAISHIGSSVVTLVFAPGTWTIDANLTIPSNFTAHIPAGCSFSVDSGFTLTFNGPVIAESATWSTGSGTVVHAYGSPFRSLGDVRLHGAVLDGVTDDTSAFQRAALASLHPYAPSGSTVITDSIPLRDNQHWTLDGTVINITGTAVQVFTVAAGIDDWSITGGSVIGDNGAAGATSGSAAGIKIIDSERWRVTNFTAQNVKGWGILVQPGSSTTDRAEHGQIINPQAMACYRGIEVQAGTGAEYVTISNPYITRCNIGAYLAAGNVNVNGGTVTDNTDGFKIGNGSNHAHATIVGVNINHNTQYNVHCDNVVNGQTFLGCHIYGLASDGASAIFMDQCKGVQFLGGHMDCDIYNYKGASSGINVIRDMYCPGSYGLKRLAGSNNGHDELLIFGCYGTGSFAPASDALDAAGVSMNDPAFLYVLAKRAASSTQSFTSTVAADCIFNTEVSDRRGVYNAATGVTTIPTGQGGIYRVRAEMIFVGTGMSTTASFVEVKVGSTSMRLFCPTIFSTTSLTFSICTDLYLNDADTVKLTATITGTTPVLGHGTYESSLTVERLS